MKNAMTQFGKTERFIIRVERNMLVAMHARAKQMGMRLSDYVRSIINNDIQNGKRRK